MGTSQAAVGMWISIHVLRVEDDLGVRFGRGRRLGFQSTSSVWRTTEGGTYPYFDTEISIHVLRVEDDRPGGSDRGSALISIHVLRVEDDLGLGLSAGQHIYFNPRPPCGGRPTPAWGVFWYRRFQSTSSVWRTTVCGALWSLYTPISIHVLRVEDDRYMQLYACKYGISIHVLRVEDDIDFVEIVKEIVIFQSTSSVWRTTRPVTGSKENGYYFNPRPPCGGRLDASVPEVLVMLFQSTSSVWRTTPDSLVGDFLAQFQSTSSVWRTTR